MTNQEAIEDIKRLAFSMPIKQYQDFQEALTLAVEALAEADEKKNLNRGTD